MDTYKSFNCDLASVKATLEEKGVAVVPGVFSASQCEELRSRAWSDFDRLVGMKQEDPSTYSRIYDLYPRHSMMIQGYSLGHMQWIWDLRQDQNLVEIFSLLWDTPAEDLLVSFDGLSFHMPPEVTGRGWFDNYYWTHTDQSRLKKGFHCIQGSVNLYPVNPGDGTLCVLEGSHKYHESYFEDFNETNESDFVKIKDDQYQYFYDRGCSFHRVLAPEGSLTLWDSRTFHQGSEPLRERAQPNFRLVSYICLTPRRLAGPGVVEKKQEALNSLRMTNHWPHFVSLFPDSRYDNVNFTNEDIGKPALTHLGRRIAGF